MFPVSGCSAARHAGWLVWPAVLAAYTGLGWTTTKLTLSEDVQRAAAQCAAELVGLRVELIPVYH
jgi:hypothetical protein